MTEILVGVSPDDAGHDAVALGAALARLLGGRVALAHVHPATITYPSIGNVDAEWEAYLAERSREAIEAAREWLGDADADATVVGHSSVGHGLRDIAEQRSSDIVVIGSATDGQPGRVSLGPVAHTLLHDGPVAVAVAPQGYRGIPDDVVRRMVVGFQDTPESADAVARARRLVPGSPLHLLTVVVRATRLSDLRIGRDAEQSVMEALAEADRRAQDALLREVDGPAEGSVIRADDAAAAMARFAWADGDVFVVASSRFGRIRRVFLGDMTHRLLRACPVPAIVLPR